MKKIYIGAIAVVVITAIVVPVIITQLPDTEDPVITSYYPSVYKLYSGTVEITMEAEDNRDVLYSIYIDDELVSTTNTYLWDTTSLEDGTSVDILFKAEDESGNSVNETSRVVVDNYINPARDDVFKLVSYNIWESGRRMRGFNGEIRPEGYWRRVMYEENADIAVLVETGGFDDSKYALLNESVNLLNIHFYDEAPYEGYSESDISAVTDGESVLSRYPIINASQIEEYRLDDDSIHYYSHDFCDVVIDIQGIVTHVIGYHGKCCNNTGEEPLTRRDEVQGILNYLDDIGDVPVIWAGDFNTFSPVDTADPELAPLGNLGDVPLTMVLNPEDPTWGTYSSKVHNFTDVYRTLNPDLKGYSFGYWEPQYWSRIDFIVVNQHWSDKIINATVGDTLSANLSSDHYAVDCFFSLDENYTFVEPLTQPPQNNNIVIHHQNNPLLPRLQKYLLSIIVRKDI